ncbi:MAG: CAF17-like 4Fe-4S cluster assembly/insertion protein YgfZ [Alphaproteobacteria bacterium]
MSEHLHDRAVVAVTGPDATTFLQGLVTNDMHEARPGQAISAALLTPQGKILFDFLIVAQDDASGFSLDCHAQVADDLVKRLGLYRLRAKVDCAVTNLHVVWVVDAPLAGGFADPRHQMLGQRAFTENPAANQATTYHQRRIALGIAEGVHDFAAGAVFPHEANLDLLGGVSFSKGCYIGQEVVSRTHHRGTARKRFFPCRASGPLPAMGAEIVAGGRIVGVTGSCVASDTGNWVMALVRLSAVNAARQGGGTFTVGECTLTPEIPDWSIDNLNTSEAGN